MRIRNLLLSTVMCGSVVLMSSASWAQTAPKVVYKPQGEWAVTRMAAKGPGKEPYCTMARRFGDNVIVTFARNAKEETSVAMDFQPNTLAKGQSYYVTLDAGQGEKRAFDVIPVSDKAMVIRMGQDTKFHDALGRSGALNVDVAGLQFEFNMPDMGKGQQDLGGCVTSIVEPAAGGVAEAAPAPSSKPAKLAQANVDGPVARHASENILAAPVTSGGMADAPQPVLHADDHAVSAAVSASSTELESLREENMRLKGALERERREYEDRAMRESAGSSQVSEVMEKLKLLERENGDLKYQLADARSALPKAGTVSSAEAAPAACIPTTVTEADPQQTAEMNMLREENARLKSDIAAQKTAMVQLEMKAAQAGDGQASADTATIARLQSRIDELVTQNSKLQADVMSAQASASTAAAVTADGSISLSQLRSVEAQLKSVETERDSLRAQITKMGEGQEEGLLKLSGSNWNLEQATRRFNEAEREIRRLGTQLEQARTQCSAEKKEIEYMLFDPEIATQEQISKLMTLETEVDSAKAELARKDTEVSAKIGEYEQKIAKLQADVSVSKASETELAALKNELAVSKQSAAEQLAAMQEKIKMEKVAVSNDLTAQIARANAEKEQMAQRVAQLEADKSRTQIAESERIALEDRISILEKDKLALEARLATAATSIQPAAGTPRAPVQEQEVAVVSATQPVEVESIAPPGAGLRPGQVSSRVDAASSAPLALSPKTAIVEDSFVPTKAVVEPVVQALAPQAVVPVSASLPTPLVTAEALSGQLRQAGLVLASGVKKVDSASGAGMVAYSWDASGLFGSAEQKPMSNPEQFQTMVNQYLDKTKARCAGDFASSPVPTMPVDGVQVASYEIACVGKDGVGATAALAFYGRDGLFTTVAHESGMDTMDMAMDARDRVIASLASAKTMN